jgi:hypothetical protein
MIEDDEVLEYALWMKLFNLNNRKYFEELGRRPSKLLSSIKIPFVLELNQLLEHL